MKYVSLVVMLGLLAGCVASGTRVGEEQVAQFERGRTSYFDVVSALGRPTTMLLHTDGTREVTYFYSQSQLKAVNFVPLLAAFQQGTTSEQTTAVFWFDARNTLVNYSLSSGAMRTGYGLQSGGRQ